MIGRPPDHLEQEGIRLAKGWLEVCEEMDIDDYVRQHATSEYLTYYEEEIAHLEEMQRQGIMV